MSMLGLVSVTYRQLSPADVIACAARAGLDCIEWGSDIHVPQTDLANARRVGEMTREAGLTVSSYGSYYRLGAGQDPAPYLDAALALGAPVIRIWAGTRGSEQTDDVTRSAWATEAKTVSRMAAERGLTVAFEYHHGTLTDTAASALSLMQAVDEPNCRLYWQPEFAKSPEVVLSELEAVAPWVDLCHVFQWNPDHSRRPLADGTAVWREFLARIPGWEGKPLLLEFVPQDDPAILPVEAESLRAIVTGM
ncbi:MAG: sugar phosphate isomerase/epimerase [Clostridia bacterium]|nr:sugar phosphate isomerase/epimerase [Clostridia bacterium]